jgi:UDP-N-acetylmuramoyl-tripeptide--D-alanyl-D-alanine ligase
MKGTLKNIVVKILIWEAKKVLKKHKPRIIAVTGSVGKTSTKDAIYTALAQSVHTRKSEKSFNSEIGVPLTVLGLPNAWNSIVGWIENIGEGFLMPWRKNKYPEWLVLEVGVDRPGDMARLSWLKTNIVVFTQFPNVPVHVEHFTSPEEVTKEKRRLKETLYERGTLIVNADDPKMHEEKVHDGQHVISYGFAEHAVVRGSDYSIVYEEGLPVGISFTVHFQENSEQVRLMGVLGQHHVYPLLAGLAVIVTEGKMFSKALAAFQEHVPAPGRMRVLKGMRGSVVVDDTYNSSPVAVQAGLGAIASLQTSGKKIVVLGDMLELGDFSVSEHRTLGREVAGIADVFITVGVRMLAAAEAAQGVQARVSRIEALQTNEEALKVLESIVSEGDIIFVKGSQGMRMEKLVENLLQDPQSAINLLVRQDTHWKAR